MKKTLKTISSIFFLLLNKVLPEDTVSENVIISKLKISRNFSPFGHLNLFDYKDPVIRKAIWLIKFKYNRKQARVFSKILHDVLIEEMSSIYSMYNFNNPLLLKVPSSKRSLRQRGFDHNKLFIKHLQKNSSIDYLGILIKIKNTERQSHFKTKTERIKNSKASFWVSKPDVVRNRNIILFDDLTTSGSTLKECKSVLKRMGAKKILFLTVAK